MPLRVVDLPLYCIQLSLPSLVLLCAVLGCLREISTCSAWVLSSESGMGMASSTIQSSFSSGLKLAFSSRGS